MKSEFVVFNISEITSFTPINFTERALQYLYVDKLNPKDKSWILLPGGILTYE